MKLVIDFDKLEYRKPRSSSDIFIDFFLRPIRKIVGDTPILPPFVYRASNKKMSYKELGKTIQFDHEQANQILVKHHVRLGARERLSASMYYPVALITPLILVVLFVVISQFLFKMDSFGLGVSSWILTIVSSILIGILALKIATILVDQHFADTLALLSGIYLLIILEKETSLADPEARRHILARIRTLRRSIVLLSLMYAKEDDLWSVVHFRQLENFVCERERWVLAPQSQTLDDLRRDFGQFVEMLVMGQFGNFAWDSETFQRITPTVAERKPAEKVIRFLAGILPFLLLLFLFLFPSQISAIGFDRNAVTLFLLAWLLLAIDSGLNLGLMERVSGLAKTFKDLR